MYLTGVKRRKKSEGGGVGAWYGMEFPKREKILKIHVEKWIKRHGGLVLSSGKSLTSTCKTSSSFTWYTLSSIKKNPIDSLESKPSLPF